MRIQKIFYVNMIVAVFLLQTLAPVVSVQSPSGASWVGHRITGTSELYRSESNSSSPGAHGWDVNENRISDILESRMSSGQNSRALLLSNRDLDEGDILCIVSTGADVVAYLPDLRLVELKNVTLDISHRLLELDPVEAIWHTGEIEWYGDVQSRNIKARDSEEYSPHSAWELGYTGEGSTICIMDTGIDNNHPSLAGKWLGGADISKPETFLTPRDGTHDADDSQGHGTTCAGIATGTGAPAGEYMGSAPDARLIDLRIGTAIGYAPGELFQDAYDASLQGSQWALDHRDDSWAGADEQYKGIDILSLSWGIDIGEPSDGQDPYSLALDKLVEEGVHVVVAAGNSGPDNDGFSAMGAADTVITVGATDDNNTVNRTDDIIAYYSSRGLRTDDGDGDHVDELKPDVSASGTNIMQCQFSRNPLNDASGNGYGNRGSGTSYATPSVAGVVALMLEANPDLTPLVSKEILRATAQRRGPVTVFDVDPFWNRDFGWGIVDGYKAVMMSRDLSPIEKIDIDLQCFIINNTVVDGINVINGIAWSRSGLPVESVEVWGWGDTEIIEIGEVSGGNYVNWTVEVRCDEESQTILGAVARRGMKESLPASVEVTLMPSPGVKVPVSFGMIELILAVVVVGLLGGATIYFIKSKALKGKGKVNNESN